MLRPSGNTTRNFSPFLRFPSGTLIFWTRSICGGSDDGCFGCGGAVAVLGGTCTKIVEPTAHSLGTTAEILLPSGVSTRI